MFAVEHTLIFRLWTTAGTWKNCERFGIWKRNEQEYDGANGHSCMMQSRSLDQIELEQIAERLRERAERNKKKQDIYRATHKEHLRAAAKVWEEDHKKRKGIYKREGGKTQTEITSGSTDVEETRKQRILHSTPCKDCGKLFGNKRELDRH